MPKSFLVKKAKRRLDEVGESNLSCSDKREPCESPTSALSMLNHGKQEEDTPSTLHHIMKDPSKDTTDAARNSSVYRGRPAERLTENWPLLPHMFFFPSLPTQGNPLAECCAPLKVQVLTSNSVKDGHSPPNEESRERARRLNKIAEKIPKHAEIQGTIRNSEIFPPWLLDSAPKFWKSGLTDGARLPLPKFNFPDSRMNRERVEMNRHHFYPFERVLWSRKRKIAGTEREISLSPQSYRLLETSQLPAAKWKKNRKSREHGEGEHQKPEKDRNIGQEKESNRVHDKDNMEQKVQSRKLPGRVLTNRMESEHNPRNIKHHQDPTDWHIVVPSRLADGMFNYHDPYSLWGQSAAVTSSVWVPDVLKTASKEDVTGDANGSKGTELWTFKTKKEGEVSCKAKEETAVFNQKEEDRNTFQPKLNSENQMAWFKKGSLSPKLIKEDSCDNKSVLSFSNDEDHVRDFQRNLRKEEEIFKDDTRSSPDHSTIKDVNLHKLVTFGHQNANLSRRFSPVEIRDGKLSSVSFRSPERVSPSNDAINLKKRKESDSLLLHQDAKMNVVEKSNDEVLPYSSSFWLLSKEPSRVSQGSVRPKLPVVASSPSYWMTKNGAHENAKKESPNGTNSHRCEICNSAFPLRRLLNRHLKTHSFYKRYTCSYCDKGFNDTFDLKRHVRTHTGIKPFKCEQCDKSFTQRCSLEAHQTRVHGIVHKFGFRERRSKMFVCEECGATFKDSQSEFMTHMASMHPNRERGPWMNKNTNLCSQVITF